MADKKLEQEWREFKSECISEDAPPVQYREMKKAFYAGAAVTFGLMRQAGELDDDLAVQELARIDSEIKTFAKEVSDDDGT